jgi:hypothetical protein
VTGPRLIPCGNPDCRICRQRPVERRREPLALDLLVGAIAIVLLAVFAFLLLPVLAS